MHDSDISLTTYTPISPIGLLTQSGPSLAPLTTSQPHLKSINNINTSPRSSYFLSYIRRRVPNEEMTHIHNLPTLALAEEINRLNI